MCGLVEVHQLKFPKVEKHWHKNICDHPKDVYCKEINILYYWISAGFDILRHDKLWECLKESGVESYALLIALLLPLWYYQKSSGGTVVRMQANSA